MSDVNYYKDNPDFDNYHKLPPPTSQQILKVHNRSWISFEEGDKGYYDSDNPKRDNYIGKPKKPRYKNKYGEFILIFTNQQCKVRKGWLKFPKILKGYSVLGSVVTERCSAWLGLLSDISFKPYRWPCGMETNNMC